MIYTDEMEQESSTEKQSDKLLSRQDFFFDRSELDMQRTRGVDVLISNLKRYRKNYKLSQEELAARSELTTRCYGQIERGEVQPRLETLDKLSYGTGLSLAVLLTENFEFPAQLELEL